MVLQTIVPTLKSMSLDIARQLSWSIAAKECNNFFDTRAHSQLVLQGSRAVQDEQVVEFVNTVLDRKPLHQLLDQPQHLTEFVNNVGNWLQAHKHNQLLGLEQFEADFSAGTTQSFDSFYWRYRNRRMRCVLGEYFYHVKSWTATNTNWAFINNQNPLMPGDALVLSFPFCDTGSAPLNYNQLMTQCDELGIPVLIDACYYTISHGVCIDLQHQCIDTVAFSLSKAFPVSHLRIGVRYTRPNSFDGQKLHNSINYNNVVSGYIGKKLIDHFSSDYIYNVYQQRQQQVCKVLGLTPSNSVLFGVGDHTWNQYNRANLLKSYKLDLDPTLFVNRISLTGVFDNWAIFEALTNEHKT